MPYQIIADTYLYAFSAPRKCTGRLRGNDSNGSKLDNGNLSGLEMLGNSGGGEALDVESNAFPTSCLWEGLDYTLEVLCTTFTLRFEITMFFH